MYIDLGKKKKKVFREIILHCQKTRIYRHLPCEGKTGKMSNMPHKRKEKKS